ncbi:GNAT family N-acetyltransferase [Zooshikella sp. RANM57]|uniref:GNAT family N-acetyltransferase n=1 Tax=Zooshikella sp. RANM57 TaxID=3425863 RepID=UPI003D6EA14E
MLMIEKYTQDKKDEWDEFVKKAKNYLFMFERDFIEYHADRFIDYSIIIREKNEIIAVLPANAVGTTLISHGGLTYGGLIIGDKIKTSKINDIFVSFKKNMVQFGFEKLIYKVIPYIFHVQPAQEDLYLLYLNDAKLIRRDVSTVIYSNKRPKLSKGKKWIINKGKKSGLSVSESTSWEAFFELLHRVLAHHNTRPVHSVDEIVKLHEKFNDNIKLIVVEVNAEIVAGTVIFDFGNVVHTQYIATSDVGKQIGALDFLLEELIVKAMSEGKLFSFGISTENNGKFLNNGLISQKENCGGRAIVLDHYEVNLNG